LLQSELKLPGPGAYNPIFDQLDKNNDSSSHALHALEARESFIKRMEAASANVNKSILNDELGCCNRLMKHLSNQARCSPLNEKEDQNNADGE
jgi:hypothetical protein